MSRDTKSSVDHSEGILGASSSRSLTTGLWIFPTGSLFTACAEPAFRAVRHHASMEDIPRHPFRSFIRLAIVSDPLCYRAEHWVFLGREC